MKTCRDQVGGRPRLRFGAISAIPSRFDCVSTGQPIYPSLNYIDMPQYLAIFLIYCECTDPAFRVRFEARFQNTVQNLAFCVSRFLRFGNHLKHFLRFGTFFQSCVLGPFSRPGCFLK